MDETTIAGRVGHLSHRQFVAQIAAGSRLFDPVTPNAGFHRKVLFLRQDVLRTYGAVAFFTLKLRVQVRLVAEVHEVWDCVDPYPWDGRTSLGIVRDGLHVRVTGLD